MPAKLNEQVSRILLFTTTLAATTFGWPDLINFRVRGVEKLTPVARALEELPETL